MNLFQLDTSQLVNGGGICSCPDNEPRIRKLEAQVRDLGRRLDHLKNMRPRQGPQGDIVSKFLTKSSKTGLTISPNQSLRVSLIGFLL